MPDETMLGSPSPTERSGGDCADGSAVDSAITSVARDDAPRVLSMLARRFGDLHLADEAVQDALIRATREWPRQGVPEEPGAWLHVVARRIAIDRIRRAGARRRGLDAAAPELVAADGSATDRADLIDPSEPEFGDERLRLLLLCCHPALSVDTQVALTLRLVGGLTTEEIAAAFLIPTPTLAQRISRAKAKIRTAGIPMSIPAEIDQRLDAVLAILYLTFNEGYLSRSDSDEHGPLRIDLCDEAIRLCRVVEVLAPDRAEPIGLLALMRFTHARRDARFDGDRLVLLDDQDRTRWHLDEIRDANGDLRRAMTSMQPGPFQLQAAIAAHHANARTAAETDWARIVSLYDQLVAMRPTPVVQLNRAAALAMADGPIVGLDALEAVERLEHYHLYHSTRAELLSRADRRSEALHAFRRAAELVTNRAEASHLADRVAAHTLA